LLGILVKTDKGEPGVTFRAYNDPPSVQNREIADEISLPKTELFMMDYECPKLKGALWYADIEGYFNAEEDCEFELGLGVYGSAKLFVDGKLLIDNDTKQTKGTMFFNCGTVEEKGTLAVKKGQTYHIKVEFGSAPTSKLNHGTTVLAGSGAVRIGGAKIIDADEEVRHAAALAKDAEQVIICAGLNVRALIPFLSRANIAQSDWESEGSDRESMSLPGHMDALISAVSAANPSTVVVMQSGTPVGMPWISSVNGLVQAWYGGNETGNAIADILFGNVNPSAKLPLSFPKRLQDNPAFLNYRTERGRTLYGEDVYVGYRWYEMLDLPALLPFGHGLSYTKFEFSDLKVEKGEQTLNVSVNVKNAGDREGAEVVQVYVAQKNPSIKRPRKELKGFTKIFLENGEEKEVTVSIPLKYAASFWDEVRDAWVMEKDTYEVLVGNTSAGERALKGSFQVEKTSWWNGI
jgi:beta-glucosidase